MKKYLMLVIVVTLVIFLAVFVMSQSEVAAPTQSTEIIPYGQTCTQDADCVCISAAPDKCGEAGQAWRCIAGICELTSLPYNVNAVYAPDDALTN